MYELHLIYLKHHINLPYIPLAKIVCTYKKLRTAKIFIWKIPKKRIHTLNKATILFMTSQENYIKNYLRNTFWIDARCWPLYFYMTMKQNPFHIHKIRKMWYDWQWDNHSPKAKQQTIKLLQVTKCSSMMGIILIIKQAEKGPKINEVKLLKKDENRPNV